MFNVYSTKSAMSASSSNVHKLLRVANFCTSVTKNEQILGTVNFQRIDKFKVYTLNKLKIISFFLHEIIEWLRVLIEKVIFVQLGLKCSNFQPLMYQVRFARISGPTRVLKMRFFVEINLFITLVKVKLILLHCTGFLPKL